MAAVVLDRATFAALGVTDYRGRRLHSRIESAVRYAFVRTEGSSDPGDVFVEDGRG